jgi:hypothetical protein
MPNLLDNNPRLNNPIFKDANGQFPILKEVIRNRVTYTILPNTDAQICFRIMAYEVENSLYDAIVANPNRCSFIVGNMVIERYSYHNWATGNRTRIFKGLQFRVDVPTRGAWGRYVNQTTRTVSATNGKLTLNRILRVKNELTTLLETHIARETEQQRIRRIETERRMQLSNQASTFMDSVLVQFPIGNSDGYSWHNDYTRLNLSITLEKYQIAKVLDALHRIRNMQTNPLDVEYILSKDY